MEFAHSAYRVNDLERSLAFYRLLGFEERRRFAIQDADFIATLALPGASEGAFIGLPGDADRLELLHTPGVAVPAGGGFHHAGVRVSNLDGLLAKLAAQGHTPLTPPHRLASGARICLVPDPDGYNVELIEPAG